MQSIVVLLEGGNKQTAIHRISQFSFGGEAVSAKAISDIIHCTVKLDYDDVLAEILHAWPTAVTATDQYFRTPLHTAVFHESTNAIRFLLKRNNQVKLWADLNGWTPLQLAVIRQNIEAIELLFQHTDEHRVIPVDHEYNLLRLAVQHNAEHSLRELRRIFALPRTFKIAPPLIIFTIQERSAMTTSKLLNTICDHYPHDIDMPDKYGLTPIHSAARLKYKECRMFIGVLHARGSTTHFCLDARTSEVAHSRFPAAYRLMRHLYFSRSVTEWLLFSLETSPTPQRRN